MVSHSIMILWVLGPAQGPTLYIENAVKSITYLNHLKKNKKKKELLYSFVMGDCRVLTAHLQLQA